MHYCRAILTLLLTTGFVWHTQAAELAPVEERLKANLENRVLIFREMGILGMLIGVLIGVLMIVVLVLLIIFLAKQIRQ